jgi:hypothetical protein
MALQVKGKLKLKGKEQVVSDRFRKREFVLTDDSTQYPQHISFQLTQDKCSLIDSVNPGDEITVSFNLRGREWKSPQGEIKYFNSLEAWRIEKGSAAGSQENNFEAMPEQTFRQEASDDLPF